MSTTLLAVGASVLILPVAAAVCTAVAIEVAVTIGRARRAACRQVTKGMDR